MLDEGIGRAELRFYQLLDPTTDDGVDEASTRWLAYQTDHTLTGTDRILRRLEDRGLIVRRLETFAQGRRAIWHRIDNPPTNLDDDRTRGLLT